MKEMRPNISKDIRGKVKPWKTALMWAWIVGGYMLALKLLFLNQVPAYSFDSNPNVDLNPNGEHSITVTWDTSQRLYRDLSDTSLSDWQQFEVTQNNVDWENGDKIWLDNEAEAGSWAISVWEWDDKEQEDFSELYGHWQWQDTQETSNDIDIETYTNTSTREWQKVIFLNDQSSPDWKHKVPNEKQTPIIISKITDSIFSFWNNSISLQDLEALNDNDNIQSVYVYGSWIISKKDFLKEQYLRAMRG